MSESVTQTPGAQGTQGNVVPTSATAADLTQTPAQAAASAPGSLVTDAGKAAAAPTSLVTDAVDPTKAATDPAKNADGTPKTAEQIAADAKTEADKNAAKVVPEKYEIKFGDKDADPAIVEAFTPLAKDLGLTQDQAQKLAEFHKSQVEGMLASQTKVQSDAWANLQTQWQGAARADKEYGHLAGGKTFDENAALIARGLSTFGTPELNKALIDSGMGNHPEVARFMYRVGKAIAEDSIRVGNGVGGSGAPQIPFANRLFPTMKA